MIKDGLFPMMNINLISCFAFSRITPPYALVILFSVTLTKYLGRGPVYPKDGFETSDCATNWWRNLLYINNIGESGLKAV
jgi:hypothetical protein